MAQWQNSRQRAIETGAECGFDADTVQRLKQESGFTWDEMVKHFDKMLDNAEQYWVNGVIPMDTDEDLPPEMNWYHLQ